VSVFFNGAPDPRIGPASTDTYEATFYWDDGSSDVVSLGIGEFFVSSSHMYITTGTYEIVITIEDDDGGTADASMSVVVKSPTPSTDDIREIIIGLKIPKGLENNLLSILEDIPHFLKHHNLHAVVHQLQAFIHYVEAQHGKKLPRDQAKTLIHTAQSVIDTLRSR